MAAHGFGLGSQPLPTSLGEAAHDDTYDRNLFS
jgi:hypothetical protein